MNYKYFKLKISDLTEEVLRASCSSAYDLKRSVDGKLVLIKFSSGSIPALVLRSGYMPVEKDAILSEIANGDWSESHAIVNNSVPKDSDGAPLQRSKITTTGWHYQLHGMEFETSKLNSVVSKKVDNTNYGFSVCKFYKLDGEQEVEITGEDLNQVFLDLNCIKTVIDWEPTHDLEIIGGMLKQQTPPASDLTLWVVGVPDVLEAYGGSKPFCVNVNLKYMGIEEGVRVDGRAPKYLTYSTVYHTTKLRLMFRHAAGLKHKMHMIFELFKA